MDQKSLAAPDKKNLLVRNHLRVDLLFGPLGHGQKQTLLADLGVIVAMDDRVRATRKDLVQLWMPGDTDHTRRRDLCLDVERCGAVR